jgi:hypothetical protein
MGTLVRLNDFRGEAHGPFFDRRELKAILELYGERVSLGEWRDYAIDQVPGRVGFAVFRSSFDWPLFVIAKFRAGTHRHGDYAVYAGPRRIALGRTIDDVLASLRAELAPAAG